MITLLTVVGARPQFVKAAVLSRKIKSSNYSATYKEILVHTGQHYDDSMSRIFFEEMEIPDPDYNLEVGSGNHGYVTGKMLAGIEELILNYKPDIVLVYGDTNSTLAGALAASKLHVPVAHVEAGLRSYMMMMPEEQNRRLTDHLSTWLFAPTQIAINNLQKEGIEYKQPEKPTADNKAVVLSGDIMYEAFLYYKKKAYEKGGKILQLINKPFILLTLHRAENTDSENNLRSIFAALNEYAEYTIVFPVHPRTRKYLKEYDIDVGKHIIMIEPVGYFEMLCLENECECIITDSGGVQKEAYFACKMCITLRDTTEWLELVDAGWNIVVGTNKQKIIKALDTCRASKMGANIQLYGNGNTSDVILNTLAI